MANKLKWIHHKSTFFEILKAQREKSKYTDATLAVDGKFYPVHRLVMSTCSEYFSEIFERTACKSPVIVLKDVQSHDIEALLDYIYVGEVDVKQDNLTSLLKTAECLRIKGLGIPEERQTKSHKNSLSNNDDACARQFSPPPKRRRHDSNAALINTNQSPHTPSNTYSNAKQEDESLFVKVEVDDSLDIYEADIDTVHDPGKVSGYNTPKKEHEPGNYDCTPLPGPSSQQFTSSASDTRQKESLAVKVGFEAAKEPDLRVRQQQHNYERGSSKEHDPLGGDDGPIIFNTEQIQGYYGSTSLPGSYLQQSKDGIANGVKNNWATKDKWDDRWLQETDTDDTPWFKWLTKSDKDGFAFCEWCGIDIEYGFNGKRSIRRHAESINHAAIKKIINDNYSVSGGVH